MGALHMGHQQPGLPGALQTLEIIPRTCWGLEWLQKTATAETTNKEPISGEGGKLGVSQGFASPA